jgi:hypothetical protein
MAHKKTMLSQNSELFETVLKISDLMKERDVGFALDCVCVIAATCISQQASDMYSALDLIGSFSAQITKNYIANEGREYFKQGLN